MSGVKGRSGRKPLPVSLHIMRGTYRADRHGPRPVPVIAGAVGPQLEIPPVPPAVVRGLGAPGRQAVGDLWMRYDAWTPAQLLVLHQVGAVTDTLDEYARIIARDGMVVVTPRGSEVPHPFLRLQAQAQRTLVLLVGALELRED